MKDISVILTRMPRKLKGSEISMQSACTNFHSNKKRLRNKRRNTAWKFGNYRKNLRRKITEKPQIQETEENVELTEATSKSNADKMDKHLNKQSHKEENSHAQDAETDEIFTLPTHEAQSEENSYGDESCVSARTLSYELHRKIITSSVSYNSRADAEINSDSLSSFSLNKALNRLTNKECDDKTSTSKYYLNKDKTKNSPADVEMSSDSLSSFSLNKALNRLANKERDDKTSTSKYYLNEDKTKNSPADVEMSSNSSSSFSLNKTLNRFANKERDDKTSTSKYYLNEDKTKKKMLKKLIRKKLKYIFKTNSIENQLNMWKFKRRMISSDEESCELPCVPRKRCRKISSDNSDNEGATTSNTKVSYDSNPRELYLSHERVDQKESQTSKQITQEARIILTKLEELDDINAIKWREKNTKDASIMIASKSLVEEQQVDKSIGTIDSNEKASECNRKSLHVTEQVKNPITLKLICQSGKLILSEGASPAEKTRDKAPSHLSDTKKLRKKYKLFKKPKVLMIKLENLQSSSSKSLPKDGGYSADKIDRLTKKYVNSVIKSSSLFKSDESLRRLVRRRKNIDNSFEHSDEKDSTKDIQITNNSDTNNDTFKIRINCKSMSIIPSSQNDVSPLNTSKKKNDKSQKTLQEIWRNAFCTQKSPTKSQTKSAQQSTSLQSTSVTRNLPKKSTDVEHKSVSSLASTSTSSKKKNTLIASSGKHVSPKKQKTPSKSTKCAETSKSELPVTDTNSAGTANVKKTVSKTLFQHKDSTIVKNLQKNTAVKNILCDVCGIVFENCRQLHIHKTSGGCKISASKSSSSSNVSELATDEVNKHRFESSRQLSRPSQRESSIENEERLVSNKVGQSLGSNKQTTSLSSSKTSEISSNILPMSNKISKFLESKLDLNSQSKEKLMNIFLKNDTQLKCNVCFKVFNNCMQLYKHIYTHSNSKLRNVYKIKSKIMEMKNNDTDVKDMPLLEDSAEATIIDEQENVNKSHTEPRVHEVSQHNLSNEKNKTSNLLEAENVTARDSEEQLSAATGAKGEKKNRMKICECHKTVKTNENDIHMEIVILCDICMILFRRFECFETHRQNSKNCVKNRRFGRKPMLLCGNCHEVFDNIRDMLYHLKTHLSSNCKATATFYCNICKVIFFGSGPHFYNHFTSHVSNPYFLTSRVSFPRRSYFGSKLVQLPTTDGSIIWETYIQIADYMCQKCKTSFITQENLTSHEKSCQSNAASMDNNTSSDSKIATKETHIWLMCGFCNKTFFNRDLFEQHSLEHKMKRNFHSYYTRVAVTALTSVFICKVCMNMSQSQETFEKHWLMHGRLQEDYVCSLCEKHFDNIDLFQKHTIAHANSNEKQQEPITCKVIYRDMDNQRNLHKHTVSDSEDLPRTNLNSFIREESIEGTASDKPCEKSSTVSASQNVLDKMIDELLGKNITTQANKGDEEVASRQSKRAAKNNNEIYTENCANKVTNKSNKSKSVDLDDSEEEKLTIIISECEDSMSEVEKKIPECSSKRKITGSTAKPSSTACRVIADEQELSNDVDVETFSDASKSSNSNTGKKLRKSVMQLDASTSVPKDNKTSVGDESTECSTTTTTTTTTTTATATATTGDNHASKSSLESCGEESPAALNVNDSNKLPKNAMSSVPKSFLRVKSLAELTNISEERCLCHLCDLQFNSTDKLNNHLFTTHILCHQQNDQACSLNDTRVQPEFNPSIVVPTMQAQNPPFYPMEYSNAPLHNGTSTSSNALMCGSIPSSNTAPQSDNSHLQLPNQMIDQTKYIAKSNLNGPVQVNNLMEVSPSETLNRFQLFSPISNPVSATQSQQSQQLRQSQQLQQSQQLRQLQQFQQPQLSQQLRQSQQLQQPQQLRQLQQLQQSQQLYQPQQLRQLQQLQQRQQLIKPQQLQQPQQRQQQGSQMPIYHQNLPQYIVQPVNKTGQFYQQQQGTSTATVKPFIQPCQVSRPLYLKTQQQGQQQKQVNVNDNVLGYLMPFARTPNNVMPANSNNVMFIPTNQIQQTPKDPLQVISEFLK